MPVLSSSNFRVCFACLWLACAASARAKNTDQRYFMFVGEPSAAAWEYLMQNPADRKAEVEAGIKAIGGEILTYFFGLGDGKTYITVALPDDNELIQAVYLMRLPSGLLSSYEIIELMPSDQMSDALKKSAELMQKERGVGDEIKTAK